MVKLDGFTTNESEIKDSAVIFDVKNEKDLCKFCYLTQSAKFVGELLIEVKFKKIEEIVLPNIDKYSENKIKLDSVDSALEYLG